MKTLLYLLLGFALFNTSPILADTPDQSAQQTADDRAVNNATPVIDDDC